MITRLIPCLLSLIAFAFAAAAPEETKPSELKVTVVKVSPAKDGVVLRFENRSEKPMQLLRPIDGSEWGWHMPVYDLSITDSSGKLIPLGGRCKLSGLYADLKWPDDYRLKILPGEAFETTIRLNRELTGLGPYGVTFRYTYDPASKTVRNFPEIKYPDDLWLGSSISDKVAIEFNRP